jgi:hypothetical protein
MRPLFTSIVSAASVLVASAAAHAALLVPGGTHLPASAEAAPGGAVIASAVVPFISPGNFSGSVLTEVLAGDPTNALGCLTFVYTVTNNGIAGPNAIGRVTIESFAGFLTDASYTAPGVGIAPALANRSAAIGDVVGFNFFDSAFDPFAGVLAPGFTSRQLVVQTNAPAFTTGTMFLIDGGITTAGVFTPIPAPGALALLTIAPLMGRRRRRG